MDDLRKLAASLGCLPQLTVSGGEPLLRDDLPEILEAFYDLARTRFFTVPTNALSPERVARLIEVFTTRCPEAYLNICLPFHGDEGLSEEILGVPGWGQKFRATYAILREKRARHRNVSCLLDFVMTRYNVDSWAEVIECARRLYPETPLGISLCRGKTHWVDAGDVPIATYEAAQRRLASRERPWSGFNPYTLIFDMIAERIGALVAEVASGRRTDIRCGAGRRLLVVYDDGSVYPCEMLEVVGLPAARDGEGPVPTDPCLGNLRDFDFDLRRLLAAARAGTLVDWIAEHDCACTWECAIYSRIIHSPTELVGLAGRALQRLTSAVAAPGGLHKEGRRS